MTDQDFLLPGRTEEFGSGVIGVCDVCGRRQAVIVLQKERFKLCVLDFLNKTWATSGKAPGAPLPVYRSERVFFPTRAERSGRAAAIVLTPTKLVKHPVVLITPDVYGLTTTVLDAAIRFAREGYEVLLPDLARTTRSGPAEHLSLRMGARTRGGVDADNARVATLLALYRDALQFLRGRDQVDAEKVGLFGVSYGGSLAALVAGLEPTVSVLGVAYPVPVRPAARLGAVAAPTLVLSAGADPGSGRFVGDLKGRSAGAGPVEVFDAPSARHDFLSRDVAAYRAPEAEAAWARLLGFFKTQLAPPPPKPPTPPPRAPTAPPATPPPPLPPMAPVPPAVPPPSAGTPPAGPAPVPTTAGPAPRS